MSRPSEPVLQLLRNIARRKGLNTAALARAAGIERARLKHLLAGSEPLTVDELILLSAVLELTPQDMAGIGLAPDIATAEEEEAAPRDPDTTLHPLVPPHDDEVELEQAVDPLGNHAEQALRLAFALGCDVLFVADATRLAGSGVPPDVLRRFPRELPIRLDAAFHRYNKPGFLPDAFRVDLSFDAVYTCLFPWDSIQQVTLFPLPPEPPDEEDTDEEDKAPTGSRSHLRLVE